MTEAGRFRGTTWALALAGTLASCSGTTSPADGAARGDVAGDVPEADANPEAGAPQCTPSHMADLLFVVDNSNGSYRGQAGLTYRLDALLGALVDGDAVTAITDLHVGVIDTDLGTPGAVVPSCANSDVGDDGRLNPVRNGLAMRAHQPWTTAPPGRRPARCTNAPDQYPAFLSFEATAAGPGDPARAFPGEARDDIACNAYLSAGGCGLEQPLEAAYRALVTHGARDASGGASPNAGFVRDGAVLGILIASDEEDGSTRDCRYAEPGTPCADATSVFDVMSPDWSSSDLNLRFYLYAPGGAQDPTWPLDRYVDPARPGRGFLSLKPGRPGLVVFGAITGTPLRPPRRANGGVDWEALLGRAADGSDGYMGDSPEGPVSMRQRLMDPMCSTRVLPACRAEGSTAPTTCDPAAQFYAWPARRIAQVTRRFDEGYGNGVLGSVCLEDHGPVLREFAAKLRARVCR